jgi:hypothetical protein
MSGEGPVTPAEIAAARAKTAADARAREATRIAASLAKGERGSAAASVLVKIRGQRDGT